MMVLTFKELGVNPSIFNGHTAYSARKEVIQIAADVITRAHNGHPHTDVETLYDWAKSKVCFITGKVSIPATDPLEWSRINY